MFTVLWVELDPCWLQQSQHHSYVVFMSCDVLEILYFNYKYGNIKQTKLVQVLRQVQNSYT